MSNTAKVLHIRCTVCGADGPLHRKYKNRCHECARTYMRESSRAQYNKDPEKGREYKRRYVERHPERARESYRKSLAKGRAQDPERYRAYKRKYETGWTRDAFDLAWEIQRACCAICGVSMRLGGTYGNSVAADHDHASGKPRALLCHACNLRLGVYEANHARFSAYLRRFST